jgi:hypothetical protein
MLSTRYKITTIDKELALSANIEEGAVPFY